MEYEDMVMQRTAKRPLGTNLARLGAIIAGKTPQDDDSQIDTLIKMNQLQTGSPEFKMKEAQTRADIELQKGLDLEKAKKERAQADYDAAVQSEAGRVGSTVPNIPSSNPMPVSGPSMTTAMPEKTGGVPQYIQQIGPSSREYDEKIGRFIEKPGKITMEKNQDYLTPDEIKANQAKENMFKDAASQNLQSIQEAKKGARFFGPAGGVPTLLSTSSLPIVGDAGALLRGKPKEYNPMGEYDERKVWENNVNKLLKSRVLDLMMQMKSQSKTGATGFGNLSDAEGLLLQQASTALSRDLPAEEALKYLDQMEQINKRILSGGQPSTGGNQVGKYSYE